MFIWLSIHDGFRKNMLKSAYQIWSLGFWGTFNCTSVQINIIIVLHYTFCSHNSNYRALIIKIHFYIILLRLIYCVDWQYKISELHLTFWPYKFTRLHIFAQFGHSNKMYTSSSMSFIFSVYHTIWIIKARCINYDTQQKSK